MARKLHRRSAERQWFQDKQSGEYTTIHKRGYGLQHRIYEIQRHTSSDPANGIPGFQIERILRMVESGFDDDAIAEILMIPVEEVGEIIEADRLHEERLLDAVKAIIG